MFGVLLDPGHSIWPRLLNTNQIEGSNLKLSSLNCLAFIKAWFEKQIVIACWKREEIPWLSCFVKQNTGLKTIKMYFDLMEGLAYDPTCLISI